MKSPSKCGGRTKRARSNSTDARNWIRDVKTKKPPAKNWVFAGSRFADDGEGGKRFMADGGEFVCVLNNPIAMLDLPLVSAGAIEDRSFEANKEKLPDARHAGDDRVDSEGSGEGACRKGSELRQADESTISSPLARD